MKKPRELKLRADGTVNITLDGDVVRELDLVRLEISKRVGFALTKSQTVQHIIHSYRESTKELDEGAK